MWQVPKGTAGADLATHARSMMPPAAGAAAQCGAHLEAFYAQHDPGTDNAKTVAGLCAFITAKRCSVGDFLRLYDAPLRDKYGQSMTEFLREAGPPKIRMPPRYLQRACFLAVILSPPLHTHTRARVHEP